MEVLAIIPARGGSKEVPRKNIRPLAGRPLIAHTIEAALGSSCVNRVVVSTDDVEIGRVSEGLGADVVWRPPDLAGDDASSESALLHVLESLAADEDYRPDIMVFLQCTSPLTTPEDIDGTVQTMIDRKADSCLAVAPFHYFLWEDGPDGDAVGLNHDKRSRARRQDRETQFIEAGSVYVALARGFVEARHRFFGKTVIHVIAAEDCVELDSESDFQIAEARLRERQRESDRAGLPDPIDAVVMDFDGVMTDNSVHVSEDGRETVVCNRSDGWALARLREMGVRMLVLSTEANSVVEARCRKLGLECISGVEEKGSRLRGWIAERGYNASNVVYVGNDVNDLTAMESVGCPVAVADASPEARRAARVVLGESGGRGAIRELYELIRSRVSDE